VTRKPRAGLLLAPGASATRDHSALVAIDECVSADGIAVSRINLPSRPVAAIAAVKEAAAELAARTKLPAERIAIGGRSFGGRMGSMAVAEGMPALGLVLVSYPLHPPGKPDQRRVEHFPQLTVPCLFVSGTRDTFATPGELKTAVKAIPGAVTLEFLEGGNHGLRRFDAQLAETVRAQLAFWV